MELIDKSALVAEIKRRRRDWWFGSSTEAKFKREECDDILSLLDTLEVKDVEEPSKNLEDKATKYAQDKYMPVQTAEAFRAGYNKCRQEMMNSAIYSKTLNALNVGYKDM